MRRHLLLSIGLIAVTAVNGPAATAPPSRAEFARYADTLLSRNYRADRPGAAVLVARGDTVLFRAARGLADVDSHELLRPDSRFRIGSVTKQFTAAGLLTLVDAGKVKLEDPLSKYVPDYPGGDRISVRQLLNHTAGIRNYTSLPGYIDSTVRRNMTTAQMIGLFKNEKPDFEPGTNWAYSNSGYVLVGAVIEAASGKPWYAYLDQALFKPLGMKHTGYALDPRMAGQEVRGYSYAGDSVVPAWLVSMTQPHAAGGLVSNVDDLLKWNRALHEGRVLASNTYTQMITPTGKAADPGVGYGFGLFVDQVRTARALQHGGRIFGFASSMSYLPGPDMTVVVLENDDAANGPDDGATLVRKLAAMALGDPYPEMRSVPVDSVALKAAEGVYRFAADVTRVLRVVDGHLTGQRDRAPRRMLTPIAPDQFLYEDGFNRFTLERDRGGKITGMRFFANGDGEGEVGVRTDEPLPAAPSGLKLPRAALERVVGKFARGGMTLTVFLDGEALKGQIAGQDPVGLRAVSPILFDVEETGATLEFAAGDAPAATVTMRQGRREMVLKRVP